MHCMAEHWRAGVDAYNWHFTTTCGKEIKEEKEMKNNHEAASFIFIYIQENVKW